MKIIFFGLGSIGRRHAKILLDNFDCMLFAYRNDKKCAGNNLGIREMYTWKEVEKLNPQVAFITNPTFLHIKTALKCASLGMHLFIEKPLSNSLDDISLLQSICRKKQLTCYTAYCLRFHPVIKKIRELIKGKNIYHIRVVCSSFLPEWRLNNNFNESYSASRKKGGGVLLDLSHEFDYIQYIFGKIKKVNGVYDKVSHLTVDSEDFADVLLTLDRRIYANLHLNFLSRIKERSLKVDFDNGCIIGDLIRNRVDYFFRDKKETFKFGSVGNEYFKQQIKYFFNNLRNPAIMSNLQESKELLRKILEIKGE